MVNSSPELLLKILVLLLRRNLFRPEGNVSPWGLDYVSGGRKSLGKIKGNFDKARSIAQFNETNFSGGESGNVNKDIYDIAGILNFGLGQADP